MKNHPTQYSPEVEALLLKLGNKVPAESLTALETTEKGLLAADATTRAKMFGKNEIAKTKPPVWWIQFIKAFSSPFTVILLALGLTSYFTDVLFASESDWTKVVLLTVMITLAGTLRFWQEFRSQKSAEKLKALVHNKTYVLRQLSTGAPEQINVEDLVPGDIVQLSAGDMIPADIRLLTSDDFFVSQSALTGESVPVEKFAIPNTPFEEEEAKKDLCTDNPLELNTLCFLGTNVVSGYATGVVITTGNGTYFGSLAQTISGERELTNFDKGVNKVSWVLIRFMMVMVPLVFIINGLTKHNWQEAFFFSVAVAVGLTPELLPLVVTTNLARGAINMGKQKVIVKKLNAIQNFGAMDVLCTDKTGTITENRVVLVRYLDPRGVENSRVMSLAYLNSFFQTGLKNLIDGAVVERMEEGGGGTDERAYRKIDEIPFDFSRRRLSVIVEKDERKFICKGAVEEILSICTHVEDGGVVVPITDAIREEAKTLTKQLNGDGLRVVAVAYKTVATDKHIYSKDDENNLILSGYIGFLDPPKESAKSAIKLLENHGVTVKIITGDNDIVTARVCRDVELAGTEILLGSEISALTDDELAARVEQVTIFAKIDPLQKARIIAAIKSNGHTVGFMGDGINDAAAMREADVGVSVSTAVDIAKEAADIILLENDLHVLDKGVIEGRIIFGNIMKYIKMTSSSNFGNVFSVLIASAFLPFLPMLPIHLLLQNLFYDFSQLSLPWDSMDADFLEKPRKWEAAGLARFMVFIGPVSSLFDITTFYVMWHVFGANTPDLQGLFQSGWFIEGLLSQTLIVHMIRTQKIPFIQSRATFPVIASTVAVMLLAMLVPFTSFGQGIGLQALPMTYFGYLVVILLGYCIVVQIVKVAYIRAFKVWL
jgi:Mg2+-importing ATPase